jgi:hypothetical protein
MEQDAAGGVAAGRAVEPDPLVREMEAVLGRRVDQLERDNQQLRRRTATLGFAVAAAFAMSAGALTYAVTAGSRVVGAVHAREFVLHDADGRVRASLGITAEGGSRLVLRDQAGSERLRMTLLSDGSPGLSFADADGRSRIVLGFLPDETANLVLADRQGRTRAVLGLMPDESSTLVFADGHGEARIGLGVDQRGGAGLTMFESEDGRHATAAPVAPDSIDVPEDEGTSG